MAAQNPAGDVGFYDHPQFLVLQECRFNKVTGASASLTDFAHFFSRNKVIVRAVHARSVSAPTLPGGLLIVTRSAVTIASKSFESATSAGSIMTITLTTLNTLSTITELLALRFSANEKGDWDIIYEFETLCPATRIGT